MSDYVRHENYFGRKLENNHNDCYLIAAVHGILAPYAFRKRLNWVRVLQKSWGNITKTYYLGKSCALLAAGNIKKG